MDRRRGFQVRSTLVRRHSRLCWIRNTFGGTQGGAASLGYCLSSRDRRRDLRLLDRRSKELWKVVVWDLAPRKLQHCLTA